MTRIEVLFILGLALIALGIGWIYRPAALIFAGTAMSLIAYRLASVSTSSETHLAPDDKQVID